MNPGEPETSAELPEPFMMSPAAPPPESGRRGLWFGVLIGGVVVALALGALVVALAVFDGPGDGSTANGREFELNGCVRSNGSDAVAIDCADADTGDYQITEVAESITDCPDETMPTVKTGPKVYCLKPYQD